MRTRVLFLAAMAILNATASAQWSAGAYIGMLVDDNSFNNYLQVHDRVTELSLQAGYAWETETSNLELSYAGVGNSFAVTPSRTFFAHEAGVTYARLFGEEEATLLTAGGSFSLRDNRDEYTLYDHTQMFLHLNVRHYLSEHFMLKGGYSFRSSSFAELSDLDYGEHVLFLQGATTLPSRTSIILQADLDFKNYATANPDSGAGTSWGSGYGRGNRSESTPGVTQLIGTLKIGQGLAEGTGLSLLGQYQTSLQKESRYLTFLDGTLTDDEVFDDHYGYEGPLASLMITQLCPADIRMRISGTVQQRRYSDRPAFDLAGAVVASQRIDDRTTFSATAEKSFQSLGIRLTLVYDHIINSSNDSFYDYRNNAFALRIVYSY